MMEHLGGPESPEKIADRQRRYEQPGEDRIFKIVDDAGADAGSVVYWQRTWRDEDVYEIGWSVLPEFQGHGIAVAATALALDAARAERSRRLVHAFPAVANAASNAICRKLGFTLIEDLEFEYPKGSLMHCNDWRLELFSE